jgi:hypothetical protein
MKLKLNIVLLLFIIAYIGKAQEADTSYWKVGGIASFTFSQVSLTNWAAGGDNSVSLTGYYDMFFNHTKGNTKFDNSIILGYGLVRQGAASFNKTDDRVNLISQINQKINGDKLFFTGLVDFRTQMDQGLNSEGKVISKFMSPGYLMVATGINFIPSDKFSLTYAPLTGKFTFVMDQDLANEGAFGVHGAMIDANGVITEVGQNSRAELGSFLKLTFKDEIFKNVTMQSRVELFANYLGNFGNVDVNLENVITMKVNDWLTVNWILQMLYDDDINIDVYDDADMLVGSGPRTQFKSVFGVGLAYKFGAKK